VDDTATTRARLPSQIRIESSAYMVNDRLLSAVRRVRRSAVGCRPRLGKPITPRWARKL